MQLDVPSKSATGAAGDSRHDEASPTAPLIRVASVPASHVYVRHLSSPDGVDDGVRRLADPVSRAANVADTSTPSPWWPPAMLDAEWVRRHHDDFDVFHIHFGFDARTPDELTALVSELDRWRKPLVLTVHDLRNPHHVGRQEHDDQLDVLVPAADGLVTLTTGAAAEIASRWRTWPVVVPHPHVVEIDDMARRQATRDADLGGVRRVGLHLKSVRAGMAPLTVLPALVNAVEALDDTVLRVDGHTELLDRTGSAYDRDVADMVRRLGDRIDLRIHDYFSDDELWDYLASLDVSVLPYRFGTHSGWLEACRDLGTRVVAPSCGYYADQGPVDTYLLDEDLFDATSLERAVERAVRRRARPVTPTQRERQRLDIALAHRRLYETVLA